MSHFNVTPAAATRFRELIAKDTQGRDIVVLLWEEPKVDNRRGPSGEVQWVREAKGRLLHDLASEQEVSDREGSIQTAGGLKFFVVERVQKNRFDGRTIDYTTDGFTLE